MITWLIYVRSDCNIFFCALHKTSIFQLFADFGAVRIYLYIGITLSDYKIAQ